MVSDASWVVVAVCLFISITAGIICSNVSVIVAVLLTFALIIAISDLTEAVNRLRADMSQKK